MTDNASGRSEGCEACILALAEDGRPAPPWQVATATDPFRAMLSIQNWVRLTGTGDGSRQDLAQNLTPTAHRTFGAPAQAPG